MSLETTKYRGYNITIDFDEYYEPDDPECYSSDDAFLVYDHNQFYVEHDNKITARDVFENMNTKYKQYRVYVVYAYIHGGVSLSLSRHGEHSCRFDTSNTGYILIKRKNGLTDSKAFEIAQHILDDWNQYLNGSYYEYKIKKDSDVIESCTGFNSKEEALNEAKIIIDKYYT